MAEDVVVEMNRYVAEADINLVIGPVFPHEVIGISGRQQVLHPGLQHPRRHRPVALGGRPHRHRGP
jgi:nickel-dependent lactate racemase